MVNTISTNISSIIFGTLVFSVIVLIIYRVMFRKSPAGKGSSCCGGCQGCGSGRCAK